MEVVSTKKRIEILKYTCFQVIPYIYSPMMGPFRTYQWRPRPCFQVQVLLSRQTGLNRGENSPSAL